MMDLPEEYQQDGMEQVLSVFATAGGDATITLVKPAFVEVMDDDDVAVAKEHGQPVVPLPSGAVYVDPGQWGIVVADVVNHISKMFGDQVGAEQPDQFIEIRDRVLEIMAAEILNPGAPRPWEES